MVLVTTAGEVGAEAALLLSRQDGTSRVTAGIDLSDIRGLNRLPTAAQARARTRRRPGTPAYANPARAVQPGWTRRRSEGITMSTLPERPC